MQKYSYLIHWICDDKILKIRKNNSVNSSITKNLDDYDEKYMKIKFNSDGELPLNKTKEILSVIIVVRAIFHEGNKIYVQVFLDECLYKLLKNIKILYYGRIHVSEGASKQCDMCHSMFSKKDSSFSYIHVTDVII